MSEESHNKNLLENTAAPIAKQQVALVLSFVWAVNTDTQGFWF